MWLHSGQKPVTQPSKSSTACRLGIDGCAPCIVVASAPAAVAHRNSCLTLIASLSAAARPASKASPAATVSTTSPAIPISRIDRVVIQPEQEGAKDWQVHRVCLGRPSRCTRYLRRPLALYVMEDTDCESKWTISFSLKIFWHNCLTIEIECTIFLLSLFFRDSAADSERSVDTPIPEPTPNTQFLREVAFLTIP
jgi:hypothetical protein